MKKKSTGITNDMQIIVKLDDVIITVNKCNVYADYVNVIVLNCC